MEPISLGLSAIGLGLKLFGGFSASSEAKKSAELDRQQAALEQSINAQRQQQMELNGRRAMLENFRNAQRQRAQGINSAVNQGAQYGTGILGGMYQNTSQAGWNALGIDQNLQIGRAIFGFNNQISNVKMQQAQVKSNLATDQGISSLGGAILTSAGTASNLLGNVFGGSNNSQAWGTEAGSPYFGPLGKNE